MPEGSGPQILRGRSTHQEHRRGVQYRDDTVRTYIRENKQDEGLFGAAGYTTGEPKWSIERWGKKMLSREVNTPSGKMTVVEAYPHILRLYARNIGYQTYTTAEIYYMNRGK